MQEFDKFGRAVVDFALLGLPAAVVNSGLKFMQKNLELSFQQRCALGWALMHADARPNTLPATAQSAYVQTVLWLLSIAERWRAGLRPLPGFLVLVLHRSELYVLPRHAEACTNGVLQVLRWFSASCWGAHGFLLPLCCCHCSG